MASIYKRGGKRNRTGRYYIAYFDHNGKRKTVSARTADRNKAQILAAKLEGDAMLRREGIITPNADRHSAAAARPLNEHLDEWHNELLDKGRTPAHADLVKARAEKVISRCKAEYIRDLAPSTVVGVLAEIRNGDAGVSAQTALHYLRAVKQFTRWLWRDKRASEDALCHLAGSTAEHDRRYVRRAFTADEVEHLIQAANSVGETVTIQSRYRV